jgi:hypothetical protein
LCWASFAFKIAFEKLIDECTFWLREIDRLTTQILLTEQKTKEEIK